MRGAGFEMVRLVVIDEDWSRLRFRRLDYIKASAETSSGYVCCAPAARCAKMISYGAPRADRCERFECAAAVVRGRFSRNPTTPHSRDRPWASVSSRRAVALAGPAEPSLSLAQGTAG